jgi:hypothetical protein
MEQLKMLVNFSEMLPKYYTYKIINWYGSFKIIIYERGIVTSDELVFDVLKKEYLDELIEYIKKGIV